MKNIQKMNVFLQGLIWGILLGIFDLLLGILDTLIHANIAGFPIFILGIVVYLFAALNAARATGKTGTGALVGLLTGFFASLIGAIGMIVTTFTNVDAARISAQSAADKLTSSAHSSVHIHYTNSLILLQTIGLAAGSIVFALVLGVICGVIGGAIGKGRNRHTDVSEYA